MSWRSSRRLLALAFIVLLVFTAPATAQGSISREQELAVGRIAAAQLMTRYRVIVDADWMNYLGSLRDSLAPFSGRQDMPPHQIVIVEESRRTQQVRPVTCSLLLG